MKSLLSHGDARDAPRISLLAWVSILLILNPGEALVAGGKWGFYPAREVALSAGGVGAAILGFSLEDRIPPAEHWYDRRDAIFWLDRPFAFRYSSGFGKASDLLLGVTAVFPYLAFELCDGGFEADLLEVAVLHLQTAAWLSGLTSLVKWATRRPRPYVYDRYAPPELLASPDSRASFFSGHTAQAFAAAELLRSVDRRNGDRWPGVVGYGLAVSTGISRIVAGQHFLTDVLAGAVVGYTFARIVTGVHRLNNATLYFRPEPGGAAVAVAVQF